MTRVQHKQEDQQQEDHPACPIDDWFCNEQVEELNRVVQEYNRFVLLEYDHTCVTLINVVINAWILTWYWTWHNAWILAWHQTCHQWWQQVLD